MRSRPLKPVASFVDLFHSFSVVCSIWFCLFQMASLPVAEEKLPRMKPSHEIYARIKWDETLDASQIIIGYEDVRLC